ncbi:hypothetical protein D3C87_82540 [compost metagenome]
MGKKLLKVHRVDFSNDNMEYKWYPVLTIPKYEQKVGDSLKARFENLGAGDLFGEVLVPIREWEEVVDTGKIKKDGTRQVRRSTKRQNVMVDGYIFVKMVMNNHTWNIVRQTTGVAGYLKTDGIPGPIEEHEVTVIKQRLNPDVATEEKKKIEFTGGVGDLIKIKSLENITATILELNLEKGFLKAVTELGIRLDVDVENAELVS